MSTLHILDQALLEVRDRLQKELQFSVDAERNINAAMQLVLDGMGNLGQAIATAFAERHRALDLAIGHGRPNPETVEHAEPVKPAKRAREVEHHAE